jgi:hypothetical protein
MRDPRGWLLLVMCALAGACGSSDLGDGPCEGDVPAAGCGDACAGDADCPLGFYCGADMTCTADCNAGGDQCPAGQTCDDRGHCAATDVDAGDDPFPDADDCPGALVDLAPLVPAVYFLIDRSGSMTADFDDGDRWEGVEEALVGPSGVVPALQDKVIFGASLYDSDNSGACPDLAPVTATLDNVQAIADLMSDNDPRGETPTGESIEALIDVIAAAPPPPDSPKIIILATDGEPDTCAQPNPQEGQAEAIAGAQAAFAAGFELYILSVGSGPGTPSEAHLQDMANAGAGLPIGGAVDADFFVATDTATLIDQLTFLINGARTCVIAVDGNVDLGRADEGTVILNGVELGFGTDWEMQDGSTLVLLGDACTTFLETPVVDLTAEFPCGVVIP